jgi:leucyl-tRNA synthetase
LCYENLRYQVESSAWTVLETFKGHELVDNNIIFPISTTITKNGGFLLTISEEESLKHEKFITNVYYEPADTIISSSGEKCVVSIIDQWFIDYTSNKLKETIKNHIAQGLSDCNIVRDRLLLTSEWITEWPCSRSIGLGTDLLNTEYIIDSLSDSTIHMAYYAIAHQVETIPLTIIQNDYNEIYDYIFGFSKNFTKNNCKLDSPKNEFEYWYPVDIRVSGKDLITNHLTMPLYNHLMIWNKQEILPQKYSVNGHLMLNGKKKSVRVKAIL